MERVANKTRSAYETETDYEKFEVYADFHLLYTYNS